MWVKMINSVGEYVAGKKYNLAQEEAEHFIISGYAEGELGREITDDERERLSKNQEVGLG
jgi:hypothetical protein